MAAVKRAPDYTGITEQWGMPAPDRQMAMARCRYDLAARHARDKAVLEIGCGSGIGLEHLRGVARSLVGGDVSEVNLREARHHVPDVPVVALDALDLPLSDTSMDTVLMLEVIYYLPDLRRALTECRRVLRPGGVLVACLPNREHPGFHPSPFSVGYPSAPELLELLTSTGFEPEVFGGFPSRLDSGAQRVVGRLTRLAWKLGLLPRTLRGRSRLKRLVHGRSQPLNSLRTRDVFYEPIEPVGENGADGFRNLYAVGRRI